MRNLLLPRLTIMLLAAFVVSTPVRAETPPHVRTPFIDDWGQVPHAILTRQALVYPQTFFLEGPGQRKVVALTYDDGPSLDTPALLDVLKANGVKATFFWVGANIERYPDIAKRALAEGHTLANHSFDHADLSTLPGDQWWTAQLGKTQAIFHDVLGITPTLIRPPYGFLKDAQILALQQRGLKAILWSVDTADWFHTYIHPDNAEASAAILDVAQRYIHPEAIVLMHDAGGRGRIPTVLASTTLIPALKAQGYEFVTVDTLLSVSAQQ